MAVLGCSRPRWSSIYPTPHAVGQWETPTPCSTASDERGCQFTHVRFCHDTIDLFSGQGFTCMKQTSLPKHNPVRMHPMPKSRGTPLGLGFGGEQTHTRTRQCSTALHVPDGNHNHLARGTRSSPQKNQITGLRIFSTFPFAAIKPRAHRRRHTVLFQRTITNNA